MAQQQSFHEWLQWSDVVENMLKIRGELIRKTLFPVNRASCYHSFTYCTAQSFLWQRTIKGCQNSMGFLIFVLLLQVVFLLGQTLYCSPWSRYSKRSILLSVCVLSWGKELMKSQKRLVKWKQMVTRIATIVLTVVTNNVFEDGATWA